MGETNRRIVLQRRPVGWVDEGVFALREAALPDPDTGDVVVRNIYVSLDPYMRGRMNEGPSYAAPFGLDVPIPARAVGRVERSAHPEFPEGAYVFGMLAWEDYSVAPGGAGLRRLDPEQAPLSYHLGVLGFPGLTAYVGMLEIGQPKPGEQVFVSAASGAVGQVAGQLARMKGARVVGSAGSAQKARFVVDELGFDAAFNYRDFEDPASGGMGAALDRHMPDGVDVYFDNVGGSMLDAVLARIRERARLVECGMISQYNRTDHEGVRNLGAIVRNRARLQGFIVGDHADKLPTYINGMAGWLREGKVRVREHIVPGLENAPATFVGMLKGENLGKTIVRLIDDPTRP